MDVSPYRSIHRQDAEPNGPSDAGSTVFLALVALLAGLPAPAILRAIFAVASDLMHVHASWPTEWCWPLSSMACFVALTVSRSRGGVIARWLEGWTNVRG